MKLDPPLVLHTALDGDSLAELGSDTIDSGRYQVVQRNGQSLASLDRSSDLDETLYLGRGSFGCVLRVDTASNVPRALKLFRPVQRSTDSSPSSSPLDEEVRLANARPFKHVSTILDSGEFKDSRGRSVYFYASHFYRGQTLGDFFRRMRSEATVARLDRFRTDALHDLVLDLIDDLLAGLEELQDAGVVHMDVKPANLIVHDTTYSASEDSSTAAEPSAPGSRLSDGHVPKMRNQLFIVDLGGAKSIRSARSGRTRLVHTEAYFPTRLYEALDYRQGTISFDALRDHWFKIDLFSAGRTLEELILDGHRRDCPLKFAEGVEQAKELFWKEVLGDDFDHVEALINTLLQATDDPTASASRARRDFQAIPARASRNVLTSELLTDRYVGPVFRTAGGYIQVAQLAADIVYHPTFQRLGRIHQLGMLDRFWLDATHTRLSHSLQTFDLAKRFVFGLNRLTLFREMFRRSDVDHLLLAAMLHDIGQYHFSKSLEDLRKLGDHSGNELLSTIKHDQELAPHFLRRKVEGAGSIAELLKRMGFDVGTIEYIIAKTAKDPTRSEVANLSRDIVSGFVDVDRISYLREDSRRTGEPFGRAINPGALIETLTIKPRSDREPAALAIEEAGIPIVDGVLVAVLQMYRSVYWSADNRAVMAAVKYVFADLLTLGGVTFDEYLAATDEGTDTQALLWLEQTYQERVVASVQGGYNPLRPFVEFRPFPYTEVVAIGRRGDTQALYDQITGHLTLSAERALLQDLARQLPGRADVRAGEILLDVPLKRRQSPSGSAPDRETQAEAGVRPKLFVCRRNPVTRCPKGWDSFYDVSSFAKLLGPVEDESARLIRVFVANGVLDRLSESQAAHIPESFLEAIRESCRSWK